MEQTTFSPGPLTLHYIHFKFKSQQAPHLGRPPLPTQPGEGRAGASKKRLNHTPAKTNTTSRTRQTLGLGGCRAPELAGGGEGVPVRLGEGRWGAHPALLSCRRGWCPPGDQGVAAIPGCEPPLCDLIKASGSLWAALSPHPSPCPHRNAPHRPVAAEGARTYLVQRFGGQLRRPKQVGHGARGCGGCTGGGPGGLRGPGPGAPACSAGAPREDLGVALLLALAQQQRRPGAATPACRRLHRA